MIHLHSLINSKQNNKLQIIKNITFNLFLILDYRYSIMVVVTFALLLNVVFLPKSIQN